MTLSKSLTQSKMSKLDEKLNSLQGFVFVVDERLDSYQKNSSLFINNLEARITGKFSVFILFKQSSLVICCFFTNFHERLKYL